MDPTIISQTAQQLQLLESRGYSDEAICRLMGVPMIIAIVGTSGGNYRMPEHATQEFLLRNIQPRIRKAEDELNAKLLTFDDFGKRRIHVCELPLRRLDAKGQAEIDKMRLEAGTMTPNELRNQYDLPAVENGDEPMASANLMTLKALIAKGEPTTELKPGNYSVKEPQPAATTNGEENNE
jgi:phage portal protein BeeE